MTIFLDDAPHLAGTVITLIILAYLTFAMRVYCRVTRASWGVEDSLMAVSVVPFAVLSISCLVASFNGVGIHVFRFSEPGNEQYMESGLFWFFMFEVFYCVTIIPVKLSIGYMLVRIAQNKKEYIYGQYGIMAMFTIMNLIAALYIIFQCNPVSAAWDSKLMAERGHCRDPAILADIYYATTAVNIFTDWATALMPIPLLWNVKLNRNAKISVAAILGLGTFASLSACIRLKYTVNLTNSDDYLFGLCNIVIWGYAENGVGIFVGNLATLRPLFRKMLSLGGTDDSSKPTGYGASGLGLPSKIQHPYQSCEGFEMRSGSGAANGDQTTTTKIHGGSPSQDSFFDETGSQKKILRADSASKKNGAKPQGIVVSRQVEISSCRIQVEPGRVTSFAEIFKQYQLAPELPSVLGVDQAPVAEHKLANVFNQTSQAGWESVGNATVKTMVWGSSKPGEGATMSSEPTVMKAWPILPF
ncbi:hypothetical protein PG985_005799 [Apiospora marii]|uniref:uncharacterized protein n=1 Tax=Apiospora marii TaxID=335849 RepID=UPI003130D4E7